MASADLSRQWALCPAGLYRDEIMFVKALCQRENSIQIGDSGLILEKGGSQSTFH